MAWQTSPSNEIEAGITLGHLLLRNRNYRAAAEMNAKLATSREITHNLLEKAPHSHHLRNGFAQLFIPVL
jgi:hypothetical protein